MSRRAWLIATAVVAILAIAAVVVAVRTGNDPGPDVHRTPSGEGGGAF